MHWTEYDSRLAAYGVAVDEHDRILLALWNEADEPLWTMPGGGVEFEETLEQGLVRELREETGYAVEPVRLLGVDTLTVSVEERTHDTGRPFRGIRVVYEVRITGGGLRNEVDGTTDEARWFPLTQVAALPRVDLVDVALRLWTTAAR
jgi:8-oxo-dGTP diphosphatase